MIPGISNGFANEQAPRGAALRIRGRYTRNGAGAIDQTTIHGKGIASVARTNAGIDTVTFNQSFLEHIYSTASVNVGAAKADVAAQPGTISDGSVTAAATMLIYSYVPTTNNASDHSLEVNFEIVFLLAKAD